MEIIPKRSIITIVIIGIILSSGAIFVLSVNLATPQEYPEDTNSRPSNIGNQPPVSDIVETRTAGLGGIESPVLNFQGSQLKTVQLISICLSILFMIAVGFGLYFGFKNIYNNRELQDYINTALELAGFDYHVGSRGRQWQINDQFMLELINEKELKFKITIQRKMSRDPQLLGFQVHNGTIHTFCTISALQLTLQRVNRLF